MGQRLAMDEPAAASKPAGRAGGQREAPHNNLYLT